MEEAIEAASQLYGSEHPSLLWSLHDALEPQSMKYDAVFDRAMLCAYSLKTVRLIYSV